MDAHLHAAIVPCFLVVKCKLDYYVHFRGHEPSVVRSHNKEGRVHPVSPAVAAFAIVITHGFCRSCTTVLLLHARFTELYSYLLSSISILFSLFRYFIPSRVLSIIKSLNQVLQESRASTGTT